jgi:transcription elongation factor Elf1
LLVDDYDCPKCGLKNGVIVTDREYEKLYKATCIKCGAECHVLFGHGVVDPNKVVD